MLTKMLSSGSTDVKFNPPYIKHVCNSMKDNKIPNYNKLGMFRLGSRHLNVLSYCIMLLAIFCIPCFLIFVLTYQQANIHLV